MGRPVVGISASHYLVEDSYAVQMGSRMVIEAVAQVARCTPLLIPSVPEAVDIPDLLDVLDGIVLTGARANVHPQFYNTPPGPAYEPYDCDRDRVVLPLVRAVIDRGVPVLGLCRGIQEMNVAFGGTLHPEIGDLPGRHRHRMPAGCKDHEVIFRLREHVRLRSGGVLSTLLGGRDEIVTNSLHGQAIETTGKRIIAEGWAKDDTIEAISIDGASTMAIGVQWHAEYKPEHDPVSKAIFEALGQAAKQRKDARN